MTSKIRLDGDERHPSSLWKGRVIMKRIRSILSMVLILVLCVGLFSGCSVTNLESISRSIEELKEEIEEQQEQQEQSKQEEQQEEQQESGETTEQNIFQKIVQNIKDEKNELEQSYRYSGDVVTENTYITYYDNHGIVNQTNIVQETNVINSGNNSVTIQNGTGSAVVDKDESGTLTSFTADEIFFVAGQGETVTFTVAAVQVTEPVVLCYGDGTQIMQMHDDGLAGDAYAEDGIYTAVTTVDLDTGDYMVASVNYWAQSGTDTSNVQTLYFFGTPTEQTAQLAEQTSNQVQSQLAAIEAAYADDAGNVPQEAVSDVIADAAAYLEQATQDGGVLLYEVDEDTIFIKFVSGLGMLYSPQVDGVDAVGSDVSMTVITCQPSLTDMGGTSYSTTAYTLPEGVNYLLEMVDDAAADVSSTFENYTFSSATNYDNEQVTLARIRAFGPNEIILWHGHGYYGPFVKSCLLTGESFDWESYYWDLSYYWDCVTNRIVRSGSKVMISSGYIEKYCGNMDNSFLYLAACYSGKTGELAQAFLDKGATAVVGNTDSILRFYNVRMLYETVENMTKINATTGNYYSLKEALQLAKSEYGASDAVYGGVGATPIIFGGSAAENYRFADASTQEQIGTLSGKVCQASDRDTPIEGATIAVYQNGSLVQTVTTDGDGLYSVSLPAGAYQIEISADGYITFSCYADVESDTNTYMETFLMVQGSETDTGTANGRVLNAVDGLGVSDVRLDIRAGWNNTSNGDVIATVYTDSAGKYTLELPQGNYTMTASKDGFISSSVNIVVQSVSSSEQNCTISPLIDGSEYRIVLTWGLNPRDLDSHVLGELSDGRAYHVYYMHKSQWDEGEEICNLDVDDTTSYGPETISLKTYGNDTVYYYVHRYSGSGTLANSGAQVKVYQGENYIGTYNVPIDQGSGDYWNVFAIKDGQLIVTNTVTSTPDTTYAGELGANAAANSNTVQSYNEEQSYDEVQSVDDLAEPEQAVEESGTDEEILTLETGSIDETGEIGEPDGTDQVLEDEWPPEVIQAYEAVLDRWNEAMAQWTVVLEPDVTSQTLQELYEQYSSDVNTAMLDENAMYSFGFVYTYADLDGNGVPELLIGAKDVEAPEDTEGEATAEGETEATEEPISARVVSIYGFDGEAAVELNETVRGAYRVLLTVYEGGKIGVYSAASAFNGIYEQYEIGEDGISAECVMQYDVVSDGADESYYYEGMEYLTEDAYADMLSEMTECQFDWMAWPET
jgi:Sec-independent protein translocase protein TatA